MLLERSVPRQSLIDDPLPAEALEEEAGFYEAYRWALNAFPTVGEASRRLQDELVGLRTTPADWRREERLRNVFLLSCALSDSVDDHLSGTYYDLGQAAAILPGLSRLAQLGEVVSRWSRLVRAQRLGRLRRWRADWGVAFDAFLRLAVVEAGPPGGEEARAASRLEVLLGNRPRGAGLDARCVKVPAAFRTQDLTHYDVLRLAGRFAGSFSENERPLLVVGLRTAGSYFAPLVCAALRAWGYRDVESLTLRPKRGVAPWEDAPLKRLAARGGVAILVDEPPDTGATLGKVVSVLRRCGLTPSQMVALLPIHPTRTDWRRGLEALPLVDLNVEELPPSEWHKERLLEPASVERRCREYFLARGYRRAWIEPSPEADRFNAELRAGSEWKFHTRLKRVYEFHLENAEGRSEPRFVLAKSVGWGWLASHAFLVANSLAGFVPPLLGLRDGILYTEWIPQGEGALAPREAVLSRVSSYVASRVRGLSLGEDPSPRLDPANQRGHELLASALSGAFGWKPVAVLERARLQRELARRSCAVPTLVDGKMRGEEWILAGGDLRKTDFEHHGMGKAEWNVSDPAYDVADAILQFQLSGDEEKEFVRQYRLASGDQGIETRLFLHKLLAGTTAMHAALQNVRDGRLRPRHADYHRAYLQAREFLTAQAARECGSVCLPLEPPRWGSRVVVLDVDGVLDKQVFGFPTTSADGLTALQLLHSHGVCVALDTARSLEGVQEYCRDYGLVGGVAEYGAVAWDAVAGRAHLLVSPEADEQMRLLRGALRGLPGVFLDEGRRHSICAFTYERGRTAPLPGGLVDGVMGDLRLDLLSARQTYLDTTVVASANDKGKGLLALLDLAGVPAAETVAVGDSEPDFDMFRVAQRSYAPRHISGRGIARMLGCRIMPRSYQGGLLAAVRDLLHGDGRSCAKCRTPPLPAGLWWELLRTADRPRWRSLAKALVRGDVLRAFQK